MFLGQAIYVLGPLQSTEYFPFRAVTAISRHRDGHRWCKILATGPIALCYALERFDLFCYGNSCAQIQDTVSLHLEFE